MIRLWFKDHTYMDAPDDVAKLYEQDPEWDHSEPLYDKVRQEIVNHYWEELDDGSDQW